MAGKRLLKEHTGKLIRCGLCAAALLALCLLLIPAVSSGTGAAEPTETPPAETPLPPEEVMLPEELPEELPPEVEEEEPVAGIPGLPPLDEPLDPDKPMIALTFDDGPGPYTDRLLDAFATYGGKATFFMVGRNIAARAETVQRAAAEGHQLASHTWSHPQLTKLGREDLIQQMTSTQTTIFETTGVETDLLRPPYGSVNKTVKSMAAELDITLVTWSVDPRDWESRDADKVYDAVLSTVKDGDIILCHDIHESTVEAMERLIPELRVRGYQLVTVSELLTSQGAALESGKVYRQRPEAPTQPTEPEAPAEPAPLETPVEPATPSEPAPPAEPAVPAEPETPTAPVSPAEPEEPASAPADPAVPDADALPSA